MFVWLPTIYGKSLLSSRTISDGLQKGLVETENRCAVLVISPLVALMIDQVKAQGKGELVVA